MSLGMRTIAWQVVTAYAGPRYGTPVTVTIYPDILHGSTTVDGGVKRTGVAESWSAVRNGAGLSAFPDLGSDYVMVSSGLVSGLWAGIQRWIATFSLSGIPAGALINWAKLRLYIRGKYDQFGYNPGFAVYQAVPTYNNNLVAADYQHIYSTALSNVLYYSTISVNANNYWTLTAAGLALIVPGSIAKFGLREYKYDGLNVQPTWQYWKGMGLYFYNTEVGTAAYKPALQVNYSPVL